MSTVSSLDQSSLPASQSVSGPLVLAAKPRVPLLHPCRWSMRTCSVSVLTCTASLAGTAADMTTGRVNRDKKTKPKKTTAGTRLRSNRQKRAVWFVFFLVVFLALSRPSAARARAGKMASEGLLPCPSFAARKRCHCWCLGPQTSRMSNKKGRRIRNQKTREDECEASCSMRKDARHRMVMRWIACVPMLVGLRWLRQSGRLARKTSCANGAASTPAPRRPPRWRQ
jgi:hypothetical protein